MWLASVALAATPPALDTRDAFGTWAHTQQTDRVIAKWGDDVPVDPARVADVVDGIEAQWDFGTGIGMPPPAGSDTHKLNVYIGGTAPFGPEVYDGVLGYAAQDADGFPMIVMHTDALPHDPTGIAAHEMFHVLQDATGAYRQSDTALWWWEATANWASVRLNEDILPYSLGAYYLLRPELPLNLVDGYATDPIVSSRRYAAFVYPLYLSAHVGGDELIAASWLEADATSDPLRVVEDALPGGPTAAEAFFDFAARNATWDWYTDGIEANVQRALDQDWVEDPTRPSGRIDTLDTWWTADAPPSTLGANYWTLDVPADEVSLTLDGDPGARLWYLAVATRTGAVHDRVEATSETGAATLQVSGLAAVDEAVVVVATWDGPRDTDGAYAYQLLVTAPEDATPTEPEGCGCAVAPSAPASWLLPLLWLGVRRPGEARSTPTRTPS